jgi:hypothetical protein
METLLAIALVALFVAIEAARCWRERFFTIEFRYRALIAAANATEIVPCNEPTSSAGTSNSEIERGSPS